MCVSVVLRSLLERMVKLGELEQGKLHMHAKLFVFTYAFLLRLPSEALPAVKGRPGMVCQANTMLYVKGQELVVELGRRKNKPRGSVLTRRCCCAAAKPMCAVHMIGPMLDGLALGQCVFGECTIASATNTLRSMLAALDVPEAEVYRTHDLRRGHAQDLADSGRWCPF